MLTTLCVPHWYRVALFRIQSTPITHDSIVNSMTNNVKEISPDKLVHLWFWKIQTSSDRYRNKWYGKFLSINPHAEFWLSLSSMEADFEPSGFHRPIFLSLHHLHGVHFEQIDSGWKFERAFSPLNSQSRDLSLFQDDDGTGYVIFASGKLSWASSLHQKLIQPSMGLINYGWLQKSDGNANLKLARLSEDYVSNPFLKPLSKSIQSCWSN